MIYDDFMLCKVTLGALKGASKLNVLLIVECDVISKNDSWFSPSLISHLLYNFLLAFLIKFLTTKRSNPIIEALPIRWSFYIRDMADQDIARA